MNLRLLAAGVLLVGCGLDGGCGDATTSQGELTDGREAPREDAPMNESDPSDSEEDAPPSVVGFPDETTTGVAPGTILEASGSITVKTPGAVIENKEIFGVVVIEANNVTIRNSRVVRQSATDRYGISTGDSEGTRIEDVEIDGGMLGSGAGTGDIGVCCSSYVMQRANVHGFRTGAHMGSNVTIESSYFHDNLPTGTIHKVSVAAHGGSDLVVRGNHLDISAQAVSSALSFYGDFGPIVNVLVEGNLFNTSGGYCLYAGSLPDKPFPLSENVEIRNNAFGRKYNSRCGIYGPAAGYTPSAPGAVWTGNYWWDSGEEVSESEVKHDPRGR